MSIRIEGRTAYVATASEALVACEREGVDDVVIEDRLESLKMQLLLRAVGA